MSERIEKALENHKKGYNCAQSVVCAYCDKFDIEEQMAFKLAEAFGLGMGTMGTCGAVTGMAMLAGMKISDGKLDAPGTKHQSYHLMKEMTKAFTAINGTVICRELKGSGARMDSGNKSGSSEIKVKSCDEYIRDAAVIVEKLLL